MKKSRIIAIIAISCLLVIAILVTLKITSGYLSAKKQAAIAKQSSDNGQVLGASTSACYTSNSSLQSFVIANQTTNFSLTFDATPSANQVYAVAGFSQGTASNFDAIAASVRFNDSGTIDVRNGAVYKSIDKIPYASNTVYHFRFDINLANHTYSVYVNAPGKTAQIIATDYPFRSTQANIKSLGYLNLWGDIGTMQICNLLITPAAVVPPIVSNPININVTSPTLSANTTSINSPVQFTASASGSHPITGFIIYANNKNIYQINDSKLNASVAMDPGVYSIYIRVWDSSGAFGTSPTFSLNVSKPSASITTPNNAKVFSSINQLKTGWGSCGTTSCAGGAADAKIFTISQNQKTPSLSGSSTEFTMAGPPYADALHWYKTAGINTATNYLWDSWVYLDQPSTTAQALEFDTFAVVPIKGVNHLFMFGSQCDYASGVWDGWNQSAGSWVPTKMPCVKFSPNTWHHLVWHVQRTGANLDQVEYLSLTIDGVVNNWNMIEPSTTTSWNTVVGVQYQQDLGSTGTTFHEWVDNEQLTVW